MNVTLDGSSLMTGTVVSSTSWAAYSATPPTSINAGNHTFSISFTNDFAKTKGNPKNRCDRSLYVDVSNFYGPNPVTSPPAVTISATPTSVTAGNAAILTWNASNANSCIATGAWSGSQPVSGSISTGALNQSSTYTLTCTGDGGTSSGSATVTVTAEAVSFISSSIKAGQTLSGSVAWTVTTTGSVAAVEFWANNNRLGTVSAGPSSWTYQLDSTKLPNGTNALGLAIVGTDGSRLTPQVGQVTVSNSASSGGTGTGQLVMFGAFHDGTLDEFGDTSCGGNITQVNSSGGPNNRPWARLVATDNQMCYGDTTNVRIHLLGFAAPGTSTAPSHCCTHTNYSWFNDKQTSYGAISLRVPSGYTTKDIYAGLEVHGDSGPQAAPVHIRIRNGQWSADFNGTTEALFPTAAFAQFAFGGWGSDPTYGGSTYRDHQDWVGGNHTVVPGEWVHFRFGVHYDYTDNNGVGYGWARLWARWGSMTSWLEVGPQKNNLVIGDPNMDGDGWTIYPMLSMYYPRGTNITHALDYAGGAYSNDLNTLASWQDSWLGF